MCMGTLSWILSWYCILLCTWPPEYSFIIFCTVPCSYFPHVLSLHILYIQLITDIRSKSFINPLTPNDLYMSRTTPLTSKRCILYIYSTNIGTKYFKHALYSPFFSLQNAVCFIMLTCLVPVLFTFYIQGVLKLKNNSGAKRLRVKIVHLVERSELIKLVVWFMREEKLYRVSIATYRDREFYGGYSELTISMFVNVKIDGLGKVWLKKLTL